MEKSFFADIKEQLEEYVEDRLLLLKLQATEKAAKASSVVVVIIAVLFLSLLVCMVITFIAGYYLSAAVGSYGGGFGILAGIYVLLIFLLVYIHKRYTGKMISDKVVKFSFENKETFTHEV